MNLNFKRSRIDTSFLNGGYSKNENEKYFIVKVSQVCQVKCDSVGLLTVDDCFFNMD